MLVDINQTGYRVLYAKKLYTQKSHIGGRSYTEESHSQKLVIYGKEEKHFTRKKVTHRRSLQQKEIVCKGISYMQKGAAHKAKFYIQRSYERKRVTHGKDYVRKGVTHGGAKG